MANKTNQDSSYFLCFDLSNCTRAAQFLSTTFVVLGFFLIYGYFLELLFRLDGMKEHSWYLTLVQFFYYTVFGLVARFSNGFHVRKIKVPRKYYLLLALLTVATMGLSNMAVGYLNYPTQVIFKCCKLIPVLIGGILIQGKRYGMIDFFACCLMSIGLILFTLADSEVQPSFNIYGVILITGALCADAVIGNVQEKIMKNFTASNAEVILFSYAFGFLYILTGLAVTGQLFKSAQFFSQFPLKTYGYGVIFSITGYMGVNAVLIQVKLFGALTAVTVTNLRKMVTIVISFIVFSKPFTTRYLWSGLVVLLGIYLNLYSKNRQYFDNLFNRILKKSETQGLAQHGMKETV